MDLLTDLFRQAGLRRRLLGLRRLGEQTALQFPCNRSVGLHLVRQGTLYIHDATLPEPLRLASGDIAVMARGQMHVVSRAASLEHLHPSAYTDGTSPRPADGASDEAAQPVTGAPSTTPRDTPHDLPQSTVISGAYQFWHTPVHPFFAELPAWFVLRAADAPLPAALAHSVDLLEQEVARREQGSESIVQGLLDVIFMLLMREIVVRQGQNPACWSHSIQDPHVRRVLQALHTDCARQWTLESLADLAGMSRTTLAERFRKAMGNTPLNYLRTVRMQKAMSALSESERSLEQIAQEVGYTDAFSFSKVFKRTVGVAPRDFRRQDEQDKGLAWRLG